jgi:hypothetical protein
VAATKELIIDAGAREHFHKDSGLLVQEGASISINGELSQDQEVMEGEVIFEGDRLEPFFSDIPGQWGSLWIASGSSDNSINYATIKNGSIGLFVEGDNQLLSPTLNIKNSRIFNNSSHNLWARTAFIEAENLVLGGSGSASLYCNLGGNYRFTHCTIANFWNNGFRTSAALVLDNFAQVSETNTFSSDLMQADFRNCIIDGNSQIELALKSNEASLFNYNFTNCMIQFNDFSEQFTGNPLYNFKDEAKYMGILLNLNADFFFSARNDFRIGLESEAIGNGDLEFAQEVPQDILGTYRALAPDIGSYQAVEKE